MADRSAESLAYVSLVTVDPVRTDPIGMLRGQHPVVGSITVARDLLDSLQATSPQLDHLH